MKTHIQRQAECILNWGKSKVRNSLVHQWDRTAGPHSFDENQWLILIELVLVVTLKNSELLIIGDE
jgi:hypothetical protein